MNLRRVLHDGGKVEAVKLGSCIRTTSCGDRVEYPRTGGHPDNPGVLNGTRNVDYEELGSIG